MTWILLPAGAVVGVAWWWHRRHAGRTWAGDLAARVRKRQEALDEIAMLERWYAAESAEERP